MSRAAATVPGVAAVARDLLNAVNDGAVSGVTIISYFDDWSFDVVSAGSVLRSPGSGIVAAHVLASDMEARLRTGTTREDRRA